MQDELEEFKYVFVGEYIFILKNKRVEYLRIFPYQSESFSSGSADATLLNLDMDDKVRIKRIMEVEASEIIELGKHVSVPALAQVVFTYTSEEN